MAKFCVTVALSAIPNTVRLLCLIVLQGRIRAPATGPGFQWSEKALSLAWVSTKWNWWICPVPMLYLQ